MIFWNFIKENKPLLIFGLLLTFFSGFGQTFLFALYVPEFTQTFDLSNTAFGSIYAGATLASAAILPFLGKLIDRYPLKHYSISVALLLAVALLVTATAPNVIVLALGVWGMRLGGQGLMTHTAVTSMGRYFDRVRGKAISFTTLGHPLGEAVLPILVALAIGAMGWRITLAGSAVVLLAVLLPYLLKGVRLPAAPSLNINKAGQQASHWTSRQILRSKAFYLIAPNVLLLSMLTTGLFFYQIALADFKGWTREWIALSFTAFALASSVSMLLAGTLVDRFSAKNLFPLYYLPFIAALLLLILFEGMWVAPAYLILTGISVGFGSTIKSAVQAEIFGTVSLGTVRSLFSTLMVISTAIGPALFGALLDGGFDFRQLLLIALAAVVLVTLQSLRIYTGFTKKRLVVRWRNYRQNTHICLS